MEEGEECFAESADLIAEGQGKFFRFSGLKRWRGVLSVVCSTPTRWYPSLSSVSRARFVSGKYFHATDSVAAEGGLMDLPVRGSGCYPAKVDGFEPECIGSAKDRTNVIPAADIVEDNNHRESLGRT